MKLHDEAQRPSGISQYLLIAETIRGWITSGRFKAGDSIATVGDLATQFGVARGTIQEALRALSSQGVIVTSRGKRSKVRQAPQLRPVFARMDLGDLLFLDKVGESLSECLSVMAVRPGEELRNSFEFEAGAVLIECRNLAFLNGRPNAYVVSYIPEDTGIVTASTSFTEYQRVLRHILDNARHIERRASAMTADPEISRLLDIPVGTAVLRYRCVVWSPRKHLDLYYEALLRSDDCEYRLDA
jgi:DNA-binding GntR family transcriptional regulator